MKFFKKIKFILACRKTIIFLPLPIFSYWEFSSFISSINKHNTNVLSLLHGLVFLGAFIAIFIYNSNSDEYRELIRQAKSIGDLDSVGKTIDSLKKVPVKGGVLKFNESIIFYSDTVHTRIIVPSKITKISMHSHFYKCMRYNVNIQYWYKNSLSIESFSAETARALCEAMKVTAAPHLLKSDASDEDED